MRLIERLKIIEVELNEYLNMQEKIQEKIKTLRKERQKILDRILSKRPVTTLYDYALYLIEKRFEKWK